MQVLQYNILNGCRTDKRYQMLKEWLRSKDYDVIGFNEMNEWTADEFKNEMEKIRFPHTYLYEMDTSDYHIGIASKFPIEFINQVEDEPFHHGMIHVKIMDIHFIVTHFCPFESGYRELEADYISNYIQDIKDPLIAMGDLNTLSPLDKNYYEKKEVKEEINRRERMALQHTSKGDINYLPMETLLNSGLYDINDEEVIDYSVPTHIDGEAMVIENIENKIYARIDYILVNKPLLEKNPTAKVIRDKEITKVSDHYPIRCDFQLK